MDNALDVAARRRHKRVRAMSDNGRSTFPNFEDEAPPFPDDEPDTERPVVRVTAEVLQFLADELGLDEQTAELVAPQVEQRAAYERITSAARRIVRDQQLARDADFAGIDVVTAAQLLDRERPQRARVFGDLLLDGHNAVVVGAKKVGKSTLSEEMVRAAVTGGQFLGRFPVTTPLRVAYLNYELDERDMDARLRSLDITRDELDRVLVVNLRGRRLPLMTAAGRKWLVTRLRSHGTQLAIIDPFGAAYASAGGESENDNAEVRRFTTALDEIKRLADVGTLVMPAHTGAATHEEGEERARGATVLGDWPDVLMYLTKDKNHDRFLRTEGRAPFTLHESRLGYDDNLRRPMLATTDLGINRRRARSQAELETVVQAVRTKPGINKGKLRSAVKAPGLTRNEHKDQAIDAALDAGHIHIHDGARSAQLHYLGPSHDENEPCPEGWTTPPCPPPTPPPTTTEQQ